MRGSAPEGQHGPRTKQSFSGSSGGISGSGGVANPSPHNVSGPRPQSSATVVHKTFPQSSQRTSGMVQNRVGSQPTRPIATVGHHQRQQSRANLSTSSPVSSQKMSNISSVVEPQNNPNILAPIPKVGQSRLSQGQKNTLASSQTAKNNFTQNQTPKSGNFGKNNSSNVSKNPTNFGEYDDQEWDVGVNHLIIDLDADIAQADRGKMGTGSAGNPVQPGTPSAQSSDDKHSLKMKIKRTKPPTKTSEAKHEIVKTSEAKHEIMKADIIQSPGTAANTPVSQSVPLHNGEIPKEELIRTPTTPSARPIFKEKRRLEINGSNSTVSTNSSSTTTISSTPIRNSTLPLSTPCTPISTPLQNISQSAPVSASTAVVSLAASLNLSTTPIKPDPSLPISTPPSSAKGYKNSLASDTKFQSSYDTSSPAAKKIKMDPCEPGSSTRDVCVGTSVGTITEPECIGPCEPGTSVTLEGIVWHETEGGVLVVNVTWRGKTYVGTLLDCTKHDWAPPRLCESPTEELDSRAPKGRAKRGRGNAGNNAAVTSNSAAPTSASAPAVSVAKTPATEFNVTETRSGKLRQSAIKGRGRGGAGAGTLSSPVKDASGKRKLRDGDISLNDNNSKSDSSKSSKKPRPNFRGSPTIEDRSSPTPESSPCKEPQTPTTIQQIIQPNVIEPVQPSPSPTLIECPEPKCGKKYKHINGLKYHQTHAHSNQNDDSESMETNGDVGKQEGVESEENNRQQSPKQIVSASISADADDVAKPDVLRPSNVDKSDETTGNNNSVVESYVIQAPSGVPTLAPAPNVQKVSGIPPLDQKLNNATTRLSQAQVAMATNTVSSQEYHEKIRNNSMQFPPPISSQNLEQSGAQNFANPTISFQQRSIRISQPQQVIQKQISNQQSIPVHTFAPSHHPSQPPLVHQTPQLTNLPLGQTQPTNLTPGQSHPPISSSRLPPPHLNSQHLQSKPSIPPGTHGRPLSMHPGIPSHLITGQGPTGIPFSVANPQHPNVRIELKHDGSNRHFQPHSGIPASTTRPSLNTDAPSATNMVVTVSGIPHGTLISSLPGTSLTSGKLKPGGRPESPPRLKELVNGSNKNEEENREDARSPACYSDISDANDSTPVIEEPIGKEFKDEKKPAIGGSGPSYSSPYDLYYGRLGQPPYPYLISPISPHGQGLPIKPGEERELKEKGPEKDKKDFPTLPPGGDFMKFPPYLYSYQHIYPSGYPDLYMRDPYKELLEKKMSNVEGNNEDLEKGPTDLSRASNNIPPSPADKEVITIKDSRQNLPPHFKEQLENRSHGPPPDRRHSGDPSAYRFLNPYDPRSPLVSAHLEKSLDPKLTGSKAPTPITACLNITAPSNKDDKHEKRPDLKSDGIKPTMETTGPPPPPTSAAGYYPPPFSYPHNPFDPYRPPPLIPGMPLGPGLPPYLTAPPPGLTGLGYRFPGCPDDLSPGGPPGSGLFPGSHKMAELQERAQKSPLSQGPMGSQMSLVSVPSHSLPPMASSPSVLAPSVSNFASSERKSPLPLGSRFPPHPSLPDGYPYTFLASQFAPHLAALGVNPQGLPMGGSPSGSGLGGAPPPPK